MVCQNCKKHPATFKFIEVHDNQSTEVHLCLSCAQEKGLTIKVSSKKGWGAEMLAKLVDDVAKSEDDRVGPVQCGECGMRYSAFKESGRLGCPDCYRTFEAKLRPLLRRIHGSPRHTGKHPAKDEETVRRIREMRKLEDELATAIEGEDFERAADLRDRILAIQAERRLEPPRAGGGER
jgi:protein arginine kinase activator